MKTYVIHIFTRYQDCSEGAAVLVSGEEGVKRELDRMLKGYQDPSGTSTYRVFEVSREIPVEIIHEDIPQPPVRRSVARIIFEESDA